VKEFWKSVQIWRSYRDEFGDFHFHSVEKQLPCIAEINTQSSKGGLWTEIPRESFIYADLIKQDADDTHPYTNAMCSLDLIDITLSFERKNQWG